MILLILAAGKSNRIYKKIGKHKCLLKIKNKTLIQKIIEDGHKTKLFNEIHVVVGFKNKELKKNLNKLNVKFKLNKDYNTKEMLFSLKVGLKNINEDVIVSYSDIYYSRKIFKKIKKYKTNQINIPIIKNWRNVWKKRNKSIFDDCETLRYDKNFNLIEIGKKIVNPSKVMGQYMGLLFIPRRKVSYIYNKIGSKNNKMHITLFLNALINLKEKIKCVPFTGKWYEFDDLNDYKNFY